MTVTYVDERSMPVVLAILAALLVSTVVAACAVAGRRRLEVLGAVMATGSALTWLLLNSLLGGPVLFVVRGDTGVHAADLLSLPAAALVVVLCRRGWREPRSSKER